MEVGLLSEQVLPVGAVDRDDAATLGVWGGGAQCVFAGGDNAVAAHGVDWQCGVQGL